MNLRGCCDWPSLACALVALVLFTLIANPTAPFEQDHIAKGAKIRFLAEDPARILTPLAGPRDFYRDDMFSLYYMAAAAGYRMIGGNVFGFSNYLAAACGAVFIYFAVRVARQSLQIPSWVALFILLSMPLTVQTFTYGNEASFSLMFMGIALWLLTRARSSALAAAGIAFTAGFFSRPDVVLWFPALCLWGVLLRSPEQSVGSRLRQLAWFGGTAFLAGATYWVVFLRTIPQGFSFDWGFKLKLVIAFLTFPFCLPLLVLLLVGGVRWVRQSRLHALLVALFILPIAYYIPMLSSPKYISPMLPMAGLLACYGWQTGPRWLRWSVAAAVPLFFLFALTPYGVFPSPRGALWYLPTADGPAPTGCYSAFYGYCREGVFQERYLEELETVQFATAYQREHPSLVLAGYFNRQTLLWEWVQTRARTDPFGISILADQLPMGDTNAVMARTSYLRGNTFKAESLGRFKAFLSEGRVKAIGPGDEPFPKAILVGNGLPPDTDRELGARILFALERSKYTGMARRSRFYADYAAICWLPKTAAEPFERAGHPTLCKDSQFFAFDKALKGGVFYSALMPLVYYGEFDPRGQIHRTSDTGSSNTNDKAGP